jgi:amino acid transporter
MNLFNYQMLRVALATIGNLAGVGVFMVAVPLSKLGLNAIYSWSIGLALAICYSLVFVKLAEIRPDDTTFISCLTPKLQGLVGLLYWLAWIIGNAILLITLVEFFGQHAIYAGIAILVVLSVIIHFAPQERFEKIEMIANFLKFCFILILPFCLYLYNPNVLKMPLLTGNINDIVLHGVIACFWPFLGLEVARLFGKPGKDLRNGVLLGVIACFVLYVLFSFFMLGSIDLSEFASGQHPFKLLIHKYCGVQYFANVIFGVFVFTLLVTLCNWMSTTARLFLAFVEDNIFCKERCSKLTPSKNSFYGLWVATAITLILFLSTCFFDLYKQFDILCRMCLFLNFVIYGLCSWRLWQLTLNEREKILGAVAMIFIIAIFCINFFAYK